MTRKIMKRRQNCYSQRAMMVLSLQCESYCVSSRGSSGSRLFPSFGKYDNFYYCYDFVVRVDERDGQKV